MSIFEALIMGLVQGLTEFLPVSSSGHLVIFGEILGLQIDDGNAFAVLLHLATFISVCIVYYKDIIELIKEFFLMIAYICRGRFDFKRPYRRMLIMLIIATVRVVGRSYFNVYIDAILSNLLVVLCSNTAVLMFIVDRLIKYFLMLLNAKIQEVRGWTAQAWRLCGTFTQRSYD